MVKFKKDYTVYMNHDDRETSEFTFKTGYSYPYKNSDDEKYITIGSDTKYRVSVMFNEWDKMKYLEV